MLAYVLFKLRKLMDLLTHLFIELKQIHTEFYLLQLTLIEQHYHVLEHLHVEVL
jgi:hypothetical protein